MEKYRPIPFYFITTNKEEELTFDAVLENFKLLKNAGYGGAVLFNKPPYGFDAKEYLSEKWFWAIENFVKAGKELGLTIWINDGFNFPPGDVAGRVQKKDPSLTAYHLVKKGGKIVPEACDWGFPAFENPRSSELFIELVYEEYEKRLGKYFGNGITGFFSDADNRRVSYRVFGENSPERNYFPWGKDFENLFINRYGYDVVPYLEQIMERCDIPQTRDYWELASDLYQSWFKNNAGWCKNHGLLYTFHTSDTSPFPVSVTERSSVFTEGRAVKFSSLGDYCGTDQELLALNGGLHYAAEMLYTPKMRFGKADKCKDDIYYSVLGDVRTKQAQSAAFLYDKRGVMCEMFAASNWNASFNRLREIASFQIMQGCTMIVPHAVHHRLRGELKFFAPPIFVTDGITAGGLKEFNEILAQNAKWANEGKLIAKIAVLDITENLWQGQKTSTLFLEICHKLNSMPQGYVIAAKSEIEKKKEEFSLIINTSDEDIDNLYGISVLNVKKLSDLDKAEELVPVKNRYSGEGNPHYMRRRLECGEALLVANIEDGKKISGTVTYEGEKFDIMLETGEIAYFSPEEKHYNKKEESGEALPEKMDVFWENENVVPLIAWKNKNDDTVLSDGNDEIVSAQVKVSGKAYASKLYIPQTDMNSIIKIEGIADKEPVKCYIFDDEYNCYELLKEDLQTVTIYKNGMLDKNNRIFITGEFDVELDEKEPYYARFLSQYNLEAFIPKSCEITLKPRRKVLKTAKSASEQGHPFYFGRFTYLTELVLSEEEKSYVLSLGETTNYAEVYVNGRKIGAGVCNPLEFMFEASGKTELKICVTPTAANFLECWQAPSGMLGGGFIREI